MGRRSWSRIDTGRQLNGIYSALMASLLLGWAPILGKFAYRAGVAPLTLAALRSLVAALLLWTFYLIFWRPLIRGRWVEILSCLMVGVINGMGSLFYYGGLQRLDASRASLLNALYPVWVIFFLAASGQPIMKLTLLRLLVSLFGAVLVTAPWATVNAPDFLGVMLMLASSAIYAWHLVMSQWILSDVRPRTATLYVITGMALTVGVARLMSGEVIQWSVPAGWQAIVALGVTTALSRMAMFLSLERLGGVQTAILSLMELGVSLALAFLLLGEWLSWEQWLGAILLLGGGILARMDVERGGAPPPAFNPMDDSG